MCRSASSGQRARWFTFAFCADGTNLATDHNCKLKRNEGGHDPLIGHKVCDAAFLSAKPCGPTKLSIYQPFVNIMPRMQGIAICALLAFFYLIISVGGGAHDLRSGKAWTSQEDVTLLAHLLSKLLRPLCDHTRTRGPQSSSGSSFTTFARSVYKCLSYIALDWKLR